MPLKLRALEPSDLDLLYELENNTSEWSSSSSPLPYSRFALKQFIKRSLTEDIYNLRQVRLVIEEVNDSTSQSIGFIDLCDFSPQHQRAEVGIILFPQFRRLDYAPKALSLLCDYARALSLHQLYAYVLEDNLPSQKTFERADFTKVACMKDWFLQENYYKNAIFYQKRL